MPISRKETQTIIFCVMRKLAYLLNDRHSDIWNHVLDPYSNEIVHGSYAKLVRIVSEFAHDHGAATLSSDDEEISSDLMGGAVSKLVRDVAIPGGVFLLGAPRLAAEIGCCLLQFEGFTPVDIQESKQELFDELSSEFKSIVADFDYEAETEESISLRLEAVFSIFVSSKYSYRPKTGGDMSVFANSDDYMQLQGNDIRKVLSIPG